MILDQHTLAHRLYKLIVEQANIIDIQHLIYKCQRLNMNWNSFDYHGQSLIHLCCLYNRLDLIQFFVQYANCDLCRTNHDGWLPLHIAIYLGYMDIVLFLFKNM